MKPIDHYDEYGYTVLKNFFSKREISLLEKVVDPVYVKWKRNNKAEIFNKKLVNMHSLSHAEHFEGVGERVEFFEAVAPIKLTRAIERMFGPDIHFHNTQLFFNPSNTERLPYWHRDMQYSPIEDAVQRDEQNKMLSLHVRVPFVRERGVEVVSGSHRRWDTELEANVRFELNGHNNNESLPDSVLIDLVPGDVLVFNAQMIHRGNYALNPSRKALDLCVGKPHPFTSQFLDEHLLPGEEEMGNITNNQWYRLARETLARG